MNVRNRFLHVHKTWSASTQLVPLSARVSSAHFTKCSMRMTILILNISFCDLESSGPSAASIAFAVILVIGGVAMVAMILICYRR